jgi:hypothetical protein
VVTWIEKSEPREPADRPGDDAQKTSRGSLTKRLTSADHARVASLLRGAVANLDAAAVLILPAYGATDRASRTFDRASAMRRGLANLTAILDDHWRAERHGGTSPYEDTT